MSDHRIDQACIALRRLQETAQAAELAVRGGKASRALLERAARDFVAPLYSMAADAAKATREALEG